MSLKYLGTILAGLLLTLGGAGCSSSGDESPETAEAGQVVITMKDFKFAGPETVAPGATVTVVNEDRASHTLTSEADDFEEVVLDGGADGTFTAPTEPGSYEYVCTYHPEMTGTLVVK